MRARDAVQCEQCGETIDSRAPHHGEIVNGVAVNRSAGGANVITLMQRSGRWLCRWCIDKRKHGHSWQQLGLFDESE